jgi:hypothetical protein
MICLLFILFEISLPVLIFLPKFLFLAHPAQMGLFVTSGFDQTLRVCFATKLNLV